MMSRKSPKIFYGWWIVLACVGTMVYIGGAISYGFTALIEPVVAEFGWSYTQVSLASSFRGFEARLLVPLMGLLVDRWGPRRLMFAGGIIIGLGLMLVSRTTSLGMFYGAFILLAIGTSACSITVMMTAVGNWFRKRVSLAAGIAMCGIGFGGFLVPLVVRLIDLFDWHTATAILALGAFGIILPLSLLFRHKPEQYGYQPDGEVVSSVVGDEVLIPAQTPEVDIRPKQALRSGTFWHLALAYVCLGMIASGTATHVMPYLSNIGITRSISGLVAGAIPLVSIGGRLGPSWLGDRFDKRWVAASGFAMISIGLVHFEYAAAGMWVLVLFVILFAMGLGGSSIMRVAMVREYFGRNRFGTIYGAMSGVDMLGVVTGPLLTGWVFDNWHSYGGIWFFFAALSIIALILVVTARRPKQVEITSAS